MDRTLGDWGVKQDNTAGRRHLEQAMEQRKGLEMSKQSADWKALRRGWCWGAKGFREELLELIAEKRGKQHYGQELKESDEQKAERLLGAMLQRLGWKEGEMNKRAKGDPRKVRMAAQLRAQTTMTWAWIAHRLAMGIWRTALNAARSAIANKNSKRRT